ncbi:MAG: hypothetical protein QMD43_03730 [Thermodesulfovibrio sp.]|uniref:hypothetical protein n=1 Tax=unclassified Thermodesulfovibrio TaxID=2645936 RepID=UPI00083B3CB1|nr:MULTISPECIES: hypothetical protein [unclassified Thermodesulfovibrio]MDI1472259.1 hypothetical protein [Thermodesulfovibrio sp. 1176]MDI6714121.1 hypothetical protein [Thermodesulfovibrio sp.]ODA44976.1 hypothetical protein THER_0341 [Thermodesulfovibrio sp. N1]
MDNSHLEKFFGKCQRQDDFIEKTYKILNNFGFNNENTIASVCTCRDELAQTILTDIKRWWGDVFNFSSLGGLFTSGLTGLKAFFSHAPRLNTKERYIFYVFSHIGIDEKGSLGFCKRRGIDNSTACGALISLLKDISEKNLELNYEKDREQSYLKERLFKEIKQDETLDLLNITKIVMRITKYEIEGLTKKIVDPSISDYALFCGIQIHYGDFNYISPHDSYVFFNNKKIILEI